MIRTQRKPPPRHLQTPPRHAGRGWRGKDNTSLLLLAVLILGSGFVVGTTATFSAVTRNAGNSFTTAALSQPSAPASPGSYMQGNTAAVTWTAADTSGFSPFNEGLGYRISRAAAGGPTDTAGTSPGCTSGGLSYATVGYSSLASYNDATIPTAAADQGEHFCFRTESVWPCCPVDGKKPVITSLDLANRVVQDVQTGYVAASVGMTATGVADGKITSGDVITVNFNQPVNISSSVTTSHTICNDGTNKVIRIGSPTTTTNTCDTSTVYEQQRFTFSGTTTTCCFVLSWPAPLNCTTDPITPSTNNTTMQSRIQTELNTCFGAGVVTVATTTSGRQNTFTFTGKWIGDMPVFSMPTNTTGRTAPPVDNQVAASGWLSLGTIGNSGTWSGSTTSRWNISAVNWTNCTVPATACNTVTITAGTQRGTNSVTMPTTGTWTFTPTGHAATGTPTGSGLLSRSYHGDLALCAANPSGSPTGGLCRPTTTNYW